jgi:sugar-specific transcriptional regulator TrmB
MGDSHAAAAAPLPERLIHEFEELGLSPYEARILLALMQLGSGNTAQLARLSGVPRTSTYQILEELNRKGLAQRQAVDGPAVWASPGREDVFDRLDANEEQRLREHRERTARLRELVAQALPPESTGAGPYVHIIQGARQVSHIYDRLLRQSENELLVFNRPPYSYPANHVNPEVLKAVGRGVTTRVLYEGEQWHHADSLDFRRAMAVYHRAGVQARLTDELPLKLAVVDRKIALLAMTDPVLPEIGFPTTLLVEHPGYAGLQADAFEHRWASGEPVVDDEREVGKRPDRWLSSIREGS